MKAVAKSGNSSICRTTTEPRGLAQTSEVSVKYSFVFIHNTDGSCTKHEAIPHVAQDLVYSSTIRSNSSSWSRIAVLRFNIAHEAPCDTLVMFPGHLRRDSRDSRTCSFIPVPNSVLDFMAAVWESRIPPTRMWSSVRAAGLR